MKIVAALLPLAIWGAPREYRDPAGFQLQLADGWQVRTFDRGVVTINGPLPDASVLILPILGRTADCASWLDQNLNGRWQAYPAVGDLQIERGQRGATARFSFRQRQSRAVMLCAETSPRTGMIYAIGGPAADFPRLQPVMAAMVKSFRYGGENSGGRPTGGTSVPMPRTFSWRDPNEGAWTIQVPEGWRPQGGIRRVSNLDVRGEVRLWSPDGASLVQYNDTRFEKCTVPGPQAITTAPPIGAGRWCQVQTGLQVAEAYVTHMWARDLGLSNIQMSVRRDRPDLAAPHNQESARNGLGNYQYSFGEVEFRAIRNGQPVEGRLQGIVQMLWGLDRSLIAGNYTMNVKGYVGPAGSGALLSRITGNLDATWQYNMQWLLENRRASQRDAQAILGFQRWSGDLSRQAFWERSEANARRSESVGDTLLGRVRLSDGQGNQYEARSGSNYYFYDEQAGRTAPTPNQAVVGANVYPGPLVDLRPLEVIR